MIDIENLTKNSANIKYFQSGQIIIRDGEALCDKMYILLNGTADVFKNYQEVGETKIATLSQGDFLGEMSLFLNKSRTATVVACEDVTTFVIDHTNVRDFFEKQPDAVYLLIQNLCSRLNNANIQMADNHVKYDDDKNNNLVDCSVSYTPISSNGEFDGSVTTFHDITDKKAVRQALQAAYEKIDTNTFVGTQLQLALLQAAYEKIDAQNQMIHSSIDYASKIQKNLLPRNRVFEDAFSDYSVIWKPRDIVGGDIYWIKNFDEGTILCVCDCTGHGTPGALLTMLVVSTFETMVNKNNYKDTSEIIWLLEQRFVSVFSINTNAQTKSKKNDVQDGCDLAVLYIAKDGNVTVSSGHTHVFVCDGKEVNQIKGQNIYIGEGKIKGKEDVKTVQIPANSDNKFYIASDGLYDQMGGTPIRPFGYKRFKEIILDNHNERQSVISDKVWEAFEIYRGKQPRRDDFEFISFKP